MSTLMRNCRTFVSISPYCFVATIACLGWVSSVTAQESENEITASLRYSDTIPGWFLPNHFDLATEPPVGTWMLPDARGIERLYGTWTIGDETRINVVLDVMSEKESLMRFSFDDDVDFRNKEDVGDAQNPVTFKIRYRDGQQETYALRFYYSPSFAKRIGNKRLMYYRGSQRTGSLQIGDKTWIIAISDDNADGIYSDLANMRGQIDLDGDRSLSRDEGFAAQTPLNLDGTYYTVARISPSGDQITLRKAAMGRIQGIVVGDKGQAVAGATIELLGQGLTTTSDAQGRFDLKIPIGRFSYLTVQADEYVPRQERLRDSVVAERPLNVEIKMQRISEQLSGELRLANGQGYHFLAGTREGLGGGDFYVSASGDTVKFFANNAFQRGLRDLGDLGEVDVDTVPISEQGTTRFGVEAIEGHSYVSLAKAGEEGNFVVFRVKQVTPGESVTIQFQYRHGNGAATRLKRAHELSRAGKLNEAIKQYRASIETLPIASAHFGLANAFRKAAKFDDARVEYQIALRLLSEEVGDVPLERPISPDGVRFSIAGVYMSLAGMEKDAGNSQEERSTWETLVQILEQNPAPEDPVYWGVIGQAFYHIDRLEDARTAMEKTIELRGEKTPTIERGPRWWYLTMTLAKLGKTEKARQHYDVLVVQLGDSGTDTQKRFREEAAAAIGLESEVAAVAD